MVWLHLLVIKTHQPLRIMSIRQISAYQLPISHHTTGPPCPPAPSASQNYKYWPSCISAMFLQLLSLLATFLFAKMTLELSMSICTSICHRNRSASQNQVKLHLYLSAILPIIYHANLPICHPAPLPQSHYANQQFFISATMTYQPSYPPWHGA